MSLKPASTLTRAEFQAQVEDRVQGVARLRSEFATTSAKDLIEQIVARHNGIVDLLLAHDQFVQSLWPELAEVIKQVMRFSMTKKPSQKDRATIAYRAVAIIESYKPAVRP